MGCPLAVADWFGLAMRTSARSVIDRLADTRQVVLHAPAERNSAIGQARDAAPEPGRKAGGGSWRRWRDSSGPAIDNIPGWRVSSQWYADVGTKRCVRVAEGGHQPVNAALDIDMTNASHDIWTYVDSVRSWLKGEGPPTHLPQHAPPVPVPVYVAALTSRTVEQAAERADGIMPIFLVPRPR